MNLNYIPLPQGGGVGGGDKHKTPHPSPPREGEGTNFINLILLTEPHYALKEARYINSIMID